MLCCDLAPSTQCHVNPTFTSVWLVQIDLGVRPEVQRGEPLSAEQWVEHQDAEGRILNVPHLKQVIFKGAC